MHNELALNNVKQYALDEMKQKITRQVNINYATELVEGLKEKD